MLLDTDLSVNISIIDLLLIKSKENKFEIATFLIKIDFDQVLEFILRRTVLNRVELSALTVPLSGNRPLSSTKVRIGHKSVERSNKNPILSRFQISSFLNRSLIRSEIPSPSIQYATKLFICKWETVRDNKKGTTYLVSNFSYLNKDWIYKNSKNEFSWKLPILLKQQPILTGTSSFFYFMTVNFILLYSKAEIREISKFSFSCLNCHFWGKNLKHDN